MAATRRTPKRGRARISHARARFLAFKTAEGLATERELRLALAHLSGCAACAAWARDLRAVIRAARRNLRTKARRR